jgi:hypothetical protein
LKLGFDRNMLPKVFQEAAMVAQSLEIRYLWIDTLCIIQDCANDWEEQAAVMGEIFEAATLTIAASSSADPSRSLFVSRLPNYQEAELFSEPVEELRDVVFKARKKITHGIHAKTGWSLEVDPLETRAWALQERVLSTRLIAFTGAELQWKCRKVKACECRQNSSPSQPLFYVPSGIPRLDSILKYSKIWSQIIEDYSNRNLKVPQDKLPALSGLASMFCAATGFTYIAGLWEESLLSDLIWQRNSAAYERSSTYLAPTFSWVSAPGAVSFRFARHSYPGTRVPHAEIVEVQYRTTARHNAYGKAASGSLKIRGHTVPARLRSSSEHPEAYEMCIDDAIYLPNTDQRATCEFSIDTSHVLSNAFQERRDLQHTSGGKNLRCTDKNAGEMVTLLSLYSIHHHKHLYQNFLILEKTSHDFDSYERIGVGTGKIYRGSGCEDSVPSEPQLVKPFEWLSIDLGRTGHSFDRAIEETLCIR